MDKEKKKWIDDLTIIAAMDLKEILVNDPSPVYLVPFRSKTGHIHPPNVNTLQDEVSEIKTYSQNRKILLNPLKTKKNLIFTT